jgi:hypothetical protein
MASEAASSSTSEPLMGWPGLIRSLVLEKSKLESEAAGVSNTSNASQGVGVSSPNSSPTKGGYFSGFLKSTSKVAEYLPAVTSQCLFGVCREYELKSKSPTSFKRKLESFNFLRLVAII